MRILSLTLVFLTLYLDAISQTNFKKTWYSGASITLSSYFDGGNVTNKKIDSTHFRYLCDGSSGICDSSGNLILCSDGFNLYDSSLNYIEDGDTLVPETYYAFYNGHSIFSQSSIILPLTNRIYYLITATCSDNNLANVWLATGSNKAPFDLLLANKIDMKANGGAGKLVERMKPIVQGEFISKTQMMACKHANGKDWWLLKMMHDSVSVYTFLVTKDSIFNNGKQSFPYPRKLAPGGNYLENMGQMQLSPDGTKFATTCNNTYNELFLADFDRCTGKLSHFEKRNIPVLPTNFPASTNEPDDKYSTGLCFSPNGRFIYTINYANIQQYDTQDPDSSTAWYHVANMDTGYVEFNGYVDAYLGFNNKIYIGNWGTGLYSIAMNVIDNPDIKGAGCNWCRKCLRFEGLTLGVTNPPCQPNYDLGELNCNPIDTISSDLILYPNPVANLLTIEGSSLIGKENDIEIYSLLGQRVYRKRMLTSTGIIQLDLSLLHTGMYILRVNDFVRKILVEK